MNAINICVGEASLRFQLSDKQANQRESRNEGSGT